MASDDFVLIDFKLRNVKDLTRAQAIEALTAERQNNSTLIRSYRRVLEAQVTPRLAWATMRVQVVTALSTAFLLGGAIGAALTVLLLRWWF